MKKLLLLFICIQVILTTAKSQGDGVLDITFAGTGIVSTNLGAFDNIAKAMVIQSDKKIVLAGTVSLGSGNLDVALVRYNSNGTLDTSFNFDGIVTTSIGPLADEAVAMAIQSDGKIIVAGTTRSGTDRDVLVIRYNSNGSLDTTFNGTGVVVTAIGTGDDEATGLVINSAGKIIVSGSTYTGFSNWDFALIQYNINGSLDTAFGSNGVVTTSVSYTNDDFAKTLTLQSDGKIILAGMVQGISAGLDAAVVRYLADGTLDNSFGTYGIVTFSFANISIRSVLVEPEGKIIIGGQILIGSGRTFLARFNANGTLDVSFGHYTHPGFEATDHTPYSNGLTSMVLLPNGKIMGTGAGTLMRYNNNGSPDLSFGTGGSIGSIVRGSSIIMQPNGKFIIGGLFYNNGFFDFGLARYNSCSVGAQVISQSNFNCSSSLGEIMVQGSGGIGSITYEWNTIPVSYSDSITVSMPGVYTVITSDSVGCSSSNSILISGPQNPIGYDLSATLVASSFRPGFTSTLWLNQYNDGCIPTTGNVMVILDTMVNYVSASPIPDSIIGDTLIWNFTNLTYDSVHITPQIIVYTPTWASIGDTVCFKTIISPLAGDIDTTNNIKQYCFPVINGYDPNDKKVYPQGLCAEGFVENNQLLTYAVRFQNTGNASATDIYVLDTLDADLNLNTVRVIGNSHSLITEVLPGNVLKFRFDNINLADSTSNEAASHGYVVFEVLPNTGLSNGTAITNNVGIYFDYNPPVYTNTVLNTISDGTVNTNVSTAGNTLIADLSGVNYQWLDCDNGNTMIVGATNQSYTASTSGSYAVIINDGCFADTSACALLTVIGISEVENSNQFYFYPNPSNNTITITVSEPTQIKIINMLGEVVIEKQIQNHSVIDINDLSNGIYFIQTKEGYSAKLIKS